MTTAKKFKNALTKMYNNGDFDKQIKHPFDKKQKKNSIKDKQLMEFIMGQYEIDNVPFILLLAELKSAETFKNVICYMMADDKEEE